MSLNWNFIEFEKEEIDEGIKKVKNYLHIKGKRANRENLLKHSALALYGGVENIDNVHDFLYHRDVNNCIRDNLY